MTIWDWFTTSTDDARPARKIAAELIARYRRESKKNAAADQALFAALCDYVGETRAANLLNCLRERRAHGDAEALNKLGLEIAVAISDARHARATSHEIFERAQPKRVTSDSQPISAGRSYAKVCEGESLSDEEENAIIFGDYLPK